MASSLQPPHAPWRWLRPAGLGTGLRRGQAMVEFSLVVTVLALLFVGVADLGRAFYYDVMVSAAALEGARAAAGGAPDSDTTVSGTTTTGVNTIVQNSVGSSASSSLTITITPAQSVRASASGVGQCTSSTCVWATVKVSYSFAPMTPWLRYFIGNTSTITRTVSMRMQTQCALNNGSLCT